MPRFRNSEDTWTSSTPVDQSEIVRAFFHQFVPDLSHGDLKFLLDCIGNSPSSQKGLQNVILKLKLEFGTELADHNSALEAQRKQEILTAATNKRLREEAIRREQRELKNCMVAMDKFTQSVLELHRLMDSKRVNSREDVPTHLLFIYDRCASKGNIKQMFGIGRPYIVPSQVENPHKATVATLKRRQQFMTGDLDF